MRGAALTSTEITDLYTAVEDGEGSGFVERLIVARLEAQRDAIAAALHWHADRAAQQDPPTTISATRGAAFRRAARLARSFPVDAPTPAGSSSGVDGTDVVDRRSDGSAAPTT